MENIWLRWVLRYPFGPSTNMEAEGLMSYSAASQQGATPMFSLCSDRMKKINHFKIAA